ncbi:mitochondrial uncoupling protein 4 isoform X1 [Chiloscyllium plagiosum]|uniref:mitochondrial uncoupling protein 4 isoform X1 n=1 Tax=Chiloscyllium plagiosum TaxID=36176 RepID=UPI001CB7DFA8|nr:mitochondrial uncoupling protein 4 isoform X1 [Chiloscyllium plagiosum]
MGAGEVLSQHCIRVAAGLIAMSLETGESEQRPARDVYSLPIKFVLTACAAAVAETVTFPFDLTKTRLQIQGESAAHHFRGGKRVTPKRGMIQTAAGIVKEEGLFKLWNGVTPAIYRHIVYSGVRMVAYEQLRDSVLHKDEDGYFPLWKAVVGGMLSGTIGQFFASPTDLVKVQMQMEGRRRLEGKPPRVHGVSHAFKKILSEGGIRGLWAGWVPNVQRAALVSLGDLTTYDTVKHFLLRHTTLKDNSLCHALSSICSGFVAATMGTPADVIKTRIMNQTRDKQGRGLLYTSTMDCLMQTVKKEGLMSLYKGFLPTWARMAPWSLTFWLTFEQIRKITGLNSF